MEGKAQAQVDDKDARRRRREVFFIFLILFVLLVLTSIEFSIGRFRTALPFNDSILFFSIININIILILLLIFLIVRNVVKLVFERRRRILGAQLRNKLVAAFDSIPPELDPASSDISLTVSDDDVIYSATIPAGTMEVKKPGASYVLSDKAGTTDGIKKATLKINSKGGGKITLKTIKLDLSNADLTDHFVHTTLRAGDFSLEHIRMWEAKGKALKPRS